MIWEGECMTGAVVVGRQANRGFIFPQAATRCWQSREPAVWIAPSHTYAGTDRHPESQIDRETYCQTFRLDVRAGEKKTSTSHLTLPTQKQDHAGNTDTCCYRPTQLQTNLMLV